MRTISPKEYLDKVEKDIAGEIDRSHLKLQSGPCSRCETGIVVLIKEVALLRLGLDKIMNDLYRREDVPSGDLN